MLLNKLGLGKFAITENTAQNISISSDDQKNTTKV